jgi:hypothetical protein
MPVGNLDWPRFGGVVAQLVERLNGIQEVRGSNPLGSTTQCFVDSLAPPASNAIWPVGAKRLESAARSPPLSDGGNGIFASPAMRNSGARAFPFDLPER